MLLIGFLKSPVDFFLIAQGFIYRDISRNTRFNLLMDGFFILTVIFHINF